MIVPSPVKAAEKRVSRLLGMPPCDDRFFIRLYGYCRFQPQGAEMAEYLGQTPRSYEDAGSLTATHNSGVSWGAIFAGALGATALSLVLLLLGTGLGFSSVSPWANQGASATTIGVAAVLWLTFTQLAASGMGGYLAGRLRTKWSGIHTDEVYFRDTAHGFLAWAVATVLTAGLLSGAVGSIIGTTAQAGASVVGGAASAAMTAGAGAAGASASNNNSASSENSGPMSYFIDSLFRRDMSIPNGASASGSATGATTSAQPQGTSERGNSNAEVARVFANSLRTGSLPPEDVKYVAQLVVQRTGLSQQDAEKRVNDTFSQAQSAVNEAKTKAQEAADKARKASAYAALWLVVSMLIGAFVAAFAGTYGGRRRDL
jgi:hypothetical protein